MHTVVCWFGCLLAGVVGHESAQHSTHTAAHTQPLASLSLQEPTNKAGGEDKLLCAIEYVFGRACYGACMRV